jgi:dipeptidyl aminopeptidase/acylaminoacyl peptidase
LSEPKVAPFGSWSSPISADLLASSAVRLGQPWIDDGAVYWLEGRPTEGGRSVVVRGDAWSTPQDVTPEGFGVRTKVHEYGGGAYLVDRGVLFFSNFEDQRLYRQEPDAVPVPITPETGGDHRYADGRITPDSSRLICVRERHDGNEVINELVVMPTDGSAQPVIIAGGRDLYASPRLSPDGTKLAWLSWDLPWMPWDGCELWVADVSADGSLSEERKVAGTDGEESIWQPDWSPTGELHFVSDRTGWWNLHRERDGELQPLCPMEAEFGWPHWIFGGSTYAFLADGRIACIYDRGDVQQVGILDPTTGELIPVDLPHTVVGFPFIVAEGERIVFLAASPTVPEQVVSLDFTSRSVDVLAVSDSVDLDARHVSVPRAIEFPTEDGLSAFANFYPPVNGDFRAPEGERPPLIVMSHGGPTSKSPPAFDIEVQYWTSRGFAAVDVNYGGSTGYGRAYRQRLNGTWGITDTMDCINAARFLASEGEVDGGRLLIRGGSAGGYTTLCALTFHDDFAAGASYYGISDLEPFALPGGTHKFESRYERTLIGPWPEAMDLYRARSPIHSVDLITTPMLVLQGSEDEVVLPAQAEIMVEALEAKGLPYAYLLFEGEQHGFRKAETIQAASEAELSFYSQILGFEPGDPIPRLKILHLDD